MEFIGTDLQFQPTHTKPTLGKDACLVSGLIERKHINKVIQNIVTDDPRKSALVSKYHDVFTGTGRFPGEYIVEGRLYTSLKATSSCNS